MRQSLAPAPVKAAVGTLALVALAAALASLTFFGVASYDTLVRLQRDRETRYRASTALVQLTALLSHLTDAETGQRGYLLTSEPDYLDPYRSGLAGIERDTVSLWQAAASDSVLRKGLGAIGPLVVAKVAFMDTTVRAFEAGARQAARDRVASRRGKTIMDSVRIHLASTAAWLQQELDARSVRVVAGWRRAQLAIVFSGVLAVITFAAAVVVVAAQFRARTRAERAARAGEHQLFQMLEAMPVGVFVLDGAGKAYYSNQRSREILGRDQDGVTGPGQLPETYHAYRAGTETLYPADALPVVQAVNGKQSHVTDIEIHRGDRVVPLEVWGAPVFDEAGRVTHAIAVFGDMTEREENRRELEAVNKELETFSYSVSHDLRAPLRAISGFSQILAQEYGDKLDPEATRLLSVIRTNTQRMGRLIDDLLTFARFSRQEVRTAPVDMDGLVRAVLDDLRNGTAEGDGRAVVTIGGLPAAQADASLLRQVWANLLGNALKYSRKEPEPRVTVEGVSRGATVEYCVRDNGVGFDMAYAGKLFGVFQRLHGTEEYEGTGVGLATVQRIVHRHGGRIWAEATPGAGATFTFTLPAEA